MSLVKAIEQMEEEIAALKQERDELAAMVAVMRDALKEQEAADNYSMHYAHLADAHDDIAAAHEGAQIKRRKALSITAPAALHEIRAQVLEEAAERFHEIADETDSVKFHHELLRTAAAERAKGEK